MLFRKFVTEEGSYQIKKKNIRKPEHKFKKKIVFQPEVQKTLRDEIRAELQKSGGKLTYESITINMPYLNLVIKEALRMHPSLVFFDRVCETEGYLLEPFSEFKMPKGMPVYIPNYCLQNDSDVCIIIFLLFL